MMDPLLRLAAVYSLHRSCSQGIRRCVVVYLDLYVGGTMGGLSR